jgi:subtilase-type serine protease
MPGVVATRRPARDLGVTMSGHKRSRAARSWLIVCTAALLTGCGGSDDGTDTASTPSAGTRPSAGALSSYFLTSFTHLETVAARLRDLDTRYVVQRKAWSFQSRPDTRYNSYPLAAARVEFAHAAGLTGRGQTIAIIDDGFRLDHEVFAGKRITTSGAVANGSHGTFVASVAAGRSPTMIGVAPGANLLLGGYSTTASIATATEAAARANAVALNNSWGYTQTLSQQSFNSVFGGSEGARYLKALDSYAAKGVVVFGISNDTSLRNSMIMEALPALRPSLEPGWIAVGNAVPTFDENRIISAQMVSSHCLEAARWCMVADGAWHAARAGSSTDYGFGVGSSFAAPQVSGALALLAEAFPNLTPHELRVRLLASADNGFFRHDGRVELAPGYWHGYSTVFGHGFLDMRAALMPIGRTTLDAGDGAGPTLAEAGVVTGAAMGDAVVRALGGLDLAVSDSFAGSFTMPAEALAQAAVPAPLAPRLLARALSAEPGELRQSGADAPAVGFAGHFGRTLSLRAGDGPGAELLLPAEGAPESDFGIAFTAPLLTGPTRLDLGIKLARDSGALVGFGGASGGAGLAAVGMSISHDFGGAFMGLSAEIGVADLEKPAGLTSVSTARFNSLSLDVGTRDAFARGDRLAIGVSLPTGLTSGTAEMALPVVLAEGGAELRSLDIPLAPQERQTDFSVSYIIPTGKRSELALELVHSENWGNRADLRDTAGALAWTFRF